jgi:hypothetical protein
MASVYISRVECFSNFCSKERKIWVYVADGPMVEEIPRGSWQPTDEGKCEYMQAHDSTHPALYQENMYDNLCCKNKFKH